MSSYLLNSKGGARPTRKTVTPSRLTGAGYFSKPILSQKSSGMYCSFRQLAGTTLP